MISGLSTVNVSKEYGTVLDVTLSFKCCSTTLVMPNSRTIDAVIASGVSAVTDLPVARNTATLTSLSLGTAAFTVSIFLL